MNNLKCILSNLTMSKKLLLGFSIVILLFLVLTGSMLIQINSISSNIQSFSDGPYKVTTHLTEVKRDYNYIMRKVYELLLDPSSLPIIESEIKMTQTKLDINLNLIESRMASKQTEIDSLKTALGGWKQEITSIVEAIQTNQHESALEIATTTAIQKINIIDQIINPLSETANSLALGFVNQSTKMANNSLYLLTLLLLVVLSITAFIIKQLIKSIKEPIAHITELANNLQQGNLKYQINYHHKDELGNLIVLLTSTIQILSEQVDEISSSLTAIAHGDFAIAITKEYKGDFAPMKDSLNQLTSTLSHTLCSIQESTSQVFFGANEVACGADVLNNGTTRQAAILTQFIASVQALSIHIANNTSQIQETSNLSATSKTSAIAGNHHMHAMIAAINKIDSSSRNISSIIQIIKEIADQTNLLALNAAIEAARAGDSGKGFAVVAREIRDLATKSSEAVNAITVLISDSLSKVSQGQTIVQATSLALEEIVTSTKQTAYISEIILEASKQQSATLSDLSTGIADISEIIHLNSTTAEESSAVSQELAAGAEMLQVLVNQFKIHPKE